MVFPQSGTTSPRHPSQLYQFLLEGLLLFVLLWLYARKPRRDGAGVGRCSWSATACSASLPNTSASPTRFLGLLALRPEHGPVAVRADDRLGVGLWLWAQRRPRAGVRRVRRAAGSAAAVGAAAGAGERPLPAPAASAAPATRERLQATCGASPRRCRRACCAARWPSCRRSSSRASARSKAAGAPTPSPTGMRPRRPRSGATAWLLMSEQFGPDAAEVKAAREHYEAALGTPEEAPAEIRLRRALVSPRTRLLQRFAAFPDGMRFLVDLRAELLPQLQGRPAPAGAGRRAGGAVLDLVRRRLPGAAAHQLGLAGVAARKADRVRGGARHPQLGRPEEPARQRPPLLRLLPPAPAGRAADLRRGGADRPHGRQHHAAAGRSRPAVRPGARHHRHLLFDQQHASPACAA